MIFRHFIAFFSLPLCCILFAGCFVLKQNAKYNFNDGIYSKNKFGGDNVYVLHIDEDTIAVFGVKEYPDSTAILVKDRVTYTTMQKRLKDNKVEHVFYKPSFDVDIITIPLKFRPATYDIPNQLISSINGAVFLGYRIDEYKLSYRRTPLNKYKQTTKHLGYNIGLYAGLGSTLITSWVVRDSLLGYEYEGVALASGISTNIALDKLTFGLSFGFDYLLDRNHSVWIYQGKPCLGLTLGLDLY